jgi:hypothetical protein
MPISRAIVMVGIVIRFGYFVIASQQKLLPHLCETGPAIFPVKQIEQGEHDRTSLFVLNVLARLSMRTW